MATRYLAVKFNPWDRRSYTYTYDGDDAVAEGVEVEVKTKDGLVRATIDSVHDVRPRTVPAHIELKSIERVIAKAPPTIGA